MILFKIKMILGPREITITERRFVLPANYYRKLSKIDDNWIICLERYWHPEYLDKKDFLEMIRILPETEFDAHLSALESMLGDIKTFKEEIYANSQDLKKFSRKITIPENIYSKTRWPNSTKAKIWYIPFRHSIMLADLNQFEEAARFVLKDVVKEKNEYYALFQNYFGLKRKFKIEDLQRIVMDSCTTYWQKEFFEKEKIVEFLNNAKGKVKIIGYEKVHPILKIDNELYALITHFEFQSDWNPLKEYLAIKTK